MSRRETVGLALSLLLHAGAFLYIGRSSKVPLDTAGPEAEPFEVEVEPEPSAEPVEARPEEPVPAGVPPAASARPTTTASRSAPESAPSVPASSEPAPATSGAFVLPSGAPTRLSDEALGLAGRNRFIGAAPGSGRETAPVDDLSQEGPRNVAPGVDRSMRDALDARDHDLGLDSAGPLVGAAETLTRGSDTPMNGTVVFEVRFDADGKVQDVRVIDAAGSRASWERLGAQFAANLRAHPIALRRKGHALTARIEVTSKWALPSGAAGGRAITGPFTNVSPESVQAGAHFDVSDIGARPARVVHAHILGETTF